MLAWLNLFCVFNLSSVVDPQSTFEGQDSTLICDDGGVGISLGLIYSAYSIFRRWWTHNLPLKGRILH